MVTLTERPRLLLHVGAMKTGTTYAQRLLDENRAVLEASGWWVPEQNRVVRATRQLLSIQGVAIGAPGSAHGIEDAPRWTRLMREARERCEQPGCRGVVISMEFLSFMNPVGAALVRDTARGLDLQVVLTARDAVSALPSQWQSLTRNGQDLSWPAFARAARVADRRPRLHGARAFRRTQDLPRMLETWSGVVAGPESLSLVTVPSRRDAPRDRLWTRLCGLLDVDPSRTRTAAFDNPRLGYGSCELMRLVNAAGMDRGAPRSYRQVIGRLTHDHLLPLRGQQTQARVDEATAEFAVGLNARTLEAARALGTLVGEEADLPVTLAPDLVLDPGDTAAMPPDDEVWRAAAALHHGAVTMCHDLGLPLPDTLSGPLPPDVPDAVEVVAAVVAIAITGDVSHRLRPRSG